jgi:hypothetical protein
LSLLIHFVGTVSTELSQRCKLIKLLTLALLSDWRNVAKRQDEMVFRVTRGEKDLFGLRTSAYKTRLILNMQHIAYIEID